tara:strand:+ start:1272 stop:4940 length:3669 start_codon:yes stop_codon:yes gene_type:complete
MSEKFTFEQLTGIREPEGNVRQKFTFDEIYKDSSGKTLIPKLEDDYLDKWLPDWIKKGYNESITGMAERVITGKERFDMSGYDSGVLSDIGSAVVGFMMPADLATAVAGGGIGSVATRAAAKTGLKRAMNMGAKRFMNFGMRKELADSVIEKGAQKIISSSATQAGAISAYTGLNSALKQQIEDNNIDWTKTLTESSKAGISGALGGALFGRAVGRGSSTTSALTQEAIGFSTADPILSGRLPEPQDYLVGLGTVLGIRTAQTVPKILKDQFSTIRRKYSNKEFDPLNRLSSSEKNDLINLAEDVAANRTLAKLGEESWSLKENIKGRSYLPAVRIIKDIRVESPVDDNLYKQIESGLIGASKGIDTKPVQKQIRDVYVSRFKQKAGNKNKKPFKEEKGFEVIEDGGSKKNKYSSKEFFSVYNRNPLVRANAESLAIKLKNTLELDDKAFLTELNGVELTKVKDGQLREINERLFKRVERNAFYKQFTNYVNEIPQKDIFDHVFGENIGRYFKSYQLSFKNPRAQSTAKLMFDAGQNINNRESSQLTKLNNSPLKEIRNNPDKQKQVYKEVIGLENVTAGNKKYVDWIRAWAKESYQYAGTGNIIRAGEIEKYLPLITKAEVKNALFDDFITIDERFGKAFDKSLVGTETQQVFSNLIDRMSVTNKIKKSTKDFLIAIKNSYNLNTTKEAYDLMMEGITPGTIAPMNFVEKSRKLKLTKENFDKLAPFFELNPFDLVAIYDHRLARRIETAKIFGRKNEVINKQIREVQSKAPIEAKLLADGIDKLTGAVENDVAKNFSPRVRKYMQNLMAFETITKISLGTATIANLGQFMISIIPQLGMFRFVRGFAKLGDANYRKQLTVPQVEMVKEILGEAGTGSAMRRYSEKFAKYSLFNPVNRFNSLMAASVAKTAIDDFIRVIRRNPDGIRGRQAIEKLKTYFNIDASGGKIPTESQVVSGMANYAKKSQLQRDFLREPFWASDPKFRPLVMFKSFGYNQAKFIKDSIKSEMSMGNPMIFLRLGLAGMAGGKFIQFAKNKMFELLSGNPVYNEKDPTFDEFIENLSAIGAFGMLTDFVDVEDSVGNLKFLVTPAFASDLINGFKVLEEFQRSVDTFGMTQTPFRRALHKAAPMFGSFPKRISERFIATEGQKRDAEKARKSRVKARILDLMIDGKTENALKNLNQWNKSFPRNPLTYDDISAKSIYRKVLNKQIRINQENIKLGR